MGQVTLHFHDVPQYIIAQIVDLANRHGKVTATLRDNKQVELGTLNHEVVIAGLQEQIMMRFKSKTFDDTLIVGYHMEVKGFARLAEAEAWCTKNCQHTWGFVAGGEWKNFDESARNGSFVFTNWSDAARFAKHFKLPGPVV